MKIRTVSYPTPVEIPIWNSGDNYFRVSISGAVGRRVRHLNTTCNTGGFFDNMTFGMSSSGSPGGYVNNGTGMSGGIGHFDGIPTTPWWFAPGIGPGGWSPGYFEMDIEIETGFETGDFVLLAESGLGYVVQTSGTPNIEEVGGPEPPAECFWTDLVRVRQTGCE